MAHTCPVHNVRLVFKPNHKDGGLHESCPTWSTTGCKVYWDRRTNKYYNQPGVVAQASTRRGRCTSKAQELLAKLHAMGLDMDWLNWALREYGYEELLKLVA